MSITITDGRSMQPYRIDPDRPHVVQLRVNQRRRRWQPLAEHGTPTQARAHLFRLRGTPRRRTTQKGQPS